MKDEEDISEKNCINNVVASRRSHVTAVMKEAEKFSENNHNDEEVMVEHERYPKDYCVYYLIRNTACTNYVSPLKLGRREG